MFIVWGGSVRGNGLESVNRYQPSTISTITAHDLQFGGAGPMNLKWLVTPIKLVMIFLYFYTNWVALWLLATYWDAHPKRFMARASGCIPPAEHPRNTIMDVALTGQVLQMRGRIS